MVWFVILFMKEDAMKKDYSKAYYSKTLADLSPSLDNIRLMIGATRHAFNRSSLAELEEVKQLQDTITLDLDEYFEEIELAQAEPDNADNFYLKQLYGILGHLEYIADEITRLGEPIRRKIRESALIADKDFFHVNDLFTHVKGLLRGLADLFHADNPPLRRYLLSEAEQILQQCFTATTEHETIMSHSFGHPHAFAIYLEMVERFKFVLNHLKNIVKAMDEKPS
jgi:Na+/phosphate symporter